ncbi:hypothetical protein RFI_07746 [Reticulomyxa filosa]|uniref:Uncharacterized protein n=1 Tax=Reticulomyxa filosa TaxID=46433 RepID=X6NTU1_RETFI|nr:hypothetical protein RFI_07746 [Reticulomyxa filosa]|eukprot:ETO29376.1 hypothetical protein RFI_07746 [Reticulomyxa filosa]
MVPIGNIFSGLYCKIKSTSHQPTKQIIRKPKPLSSLSLQALPQNNDINIPKLTRRNLESTAPFPDKSVECRASPFQRPKNKRLRHLNVSTLVEWQSLLPKKRKKKMTKKELYTLLIFCCCPFS